jgi:alkylated DNA repair protein (DNA oxidative demethylase)
MTFVDPPSPASARPGFRLLANCLSADAQARLVAEVLAATAEAPFYRPVTPGGGRMSVEITSLGALGWTSDAKGYRYQSHHPFTGRPWPPIPSQLLEIWNDLAGTAVAPDSCLVNLYRAGARMGLHQDRDEADMAFPVLSVSLGDTALFRIGGQSRRAPSGQVRLASGDVCLLAGPARLAFHGVDRIIAESSRLIPGGGRLNLTLRRAAVSD